MFTFWISRLREHIQGVDNNPLLIFPEGTCVNNHYTVMFKKVCPIFPKSLYLDVYDAFAEILTLDKFRFTVSKT